MATRAGDGTVTLRLFASRRAAARTTPHQRRRGFSPLNFSLQTTKSADVQSGAPSHVRRVVVPLLLQVLLWTALTFAFAALLIVASPIPWLNALHFSALNWMPWALLAPAVFWFSGRFPLERGHLLRSVPAHAFGCVACVTATLWLATNLNLLIPPPRLLRTPAIERGPIDHDGAHRDGFAGRDELRRNLGLTPRPERTDRAARPEQRELFNRRRSFWWPFLGTALLRVNFDAAVYLIVAIAAHALSFYRRAQDRERHAVALAAGLNRAKLEALRLQLQPHFLFNTLNAISTLVHRDATAADELISDLSELLRISLQTSEHEVSLSRELELLDRYLAIEKARLADRLRIVMDVEPAALPALVPTFLLQPIVENSIRHGIEPRLAPGTVTIRARRAGDRLELSVIDDGVGLTPARKPSAGRGIGISNTEARLRALHGEAAQLSFGTPPAGGVAVRITLPFTTVRRPESIATPAAAPAS
ncbi:MAG TPA: histidine kinase [Opitutaceae bacterium]|nr:histidine kinase [Opitutaceae bacterium]